MTASRGWTATGVLAALALAGQAAALCLVDAPRFAVYQHYADWRAIPSHPVALAVLALELAVCLTLAFQQRADLTRIVARIPGRGIALVVLAVGFAAAVPTADAARFAREVVTSAAVTVLALLNLWLAARAMPATGLARARDGIASRLTLGGDDAGPLRPWDRALPWVLAAWVLVVSAALAVTVFERLPHIDDSVSYYFQARVLASGRLWVPAPPDSAAFHVDEVIITGGKWFGYAFPGWPAVLAVGCALGVPWLINPLLGAATILLGHALVRRLSGRGDANLAALLLAGSPWLLWMSAEFMGHPLSCVATLAALLAAVRAREAPGWRWGIAGGVALGILALTRPFDAVLVGAVAALWLMRSAGFAAALRSLAPAAAAAALVAALVLPYDRALTGRATYPPHSLWTDRAWGPGVDRIGFGADVGIPAWRNIDPLPGHGPVDVVLNWNKNVFTASTDVFGWAAGSLSLLWLGLALGGWRRNDLLPAGIALGFVAGYAAYWFSGGPDFGPRYWFPALVPIAALTVRAGRSAVRRLDAEPPRVAAGVAIALVGGLLCYVPWRAVTKYYHYRDVSGDIRALAAARGFARSLVLIRGDARQDYQSAFSLNPVPLGGEVPVYARSAGAAQTSRVVNAFADRPVWVVARDPGSRRFVVRAGPLPPGTDRW